MIATTSRGATRSSTCGRSWAAAARRRGRTCFSLSSKGTDDEDQNWPSRICGRLASRRGHIALVKDWIEVGEKLGATFVRVFSGPDMPKGSNFEKVLQYMVPAFQECADYGKKHGVIVALQHHDDFLKTTEQTVQVVK